MTSPQLVSQEPPLSVLVQMRTKTDAEIPIVRLLLPLASYLLWALLFTVAWWSAGASEIVGNGISASILINLTPFAAGLGVLGLAASVAAAYVVFTLVNRGNEHSSRTRALLFGAPSFITIMFNGFILGVLVAPQLSPSLTMFFAAILPHGIIEIPSFVLSGSVGLRLGYAALKMRFRHGPESEEYLSKTLRLAVYVVVGLAPLFLVAGLIEADITPTIMRMFGWTF